MENQRDLIINSGEWGMLRTDKGQVTTVVGPYNLTIGANQAFGYWDSKTRRFVQATTPESAIQPMILAKQNQYVVLQSPAEKGVHPKVGDQTSPPDLNHGQVEIIPGPISFALFVGQTATVIDGHRLDENQFVIIEILDAQEAENNWVGGPKPWAKLPPQLSSGNQQTDGAGEQAPNTTPTPAALPEPTLQNGMRFIIRGDEWSYFVPPTGVIVVPEGNDGNRSAAENNLKYVRDAVVLQTLEYCVLIGETGQKDVVIGPANVFPRTAGEMFYKHDGKRVFRPIELGGNRMGIYVKALVDFTDEILGNWTAGQEGFLTGEKVAFFYPDPRLEVIMYGNKVVQYAVTVPKGEAYYLLNRNNGEITLVEGPQMLLPNPVEFVFVNRILTQEVANVWFPGSRSKRRAQADYAELRRALEAEQDLEQPSEDRTVGFEAVIAFSVSRSTKFTPPRSVALSDEVPQALRINVYRNFAVLVADGAGNTELVIGPTVRFLQYDETLVPFTTLLGTQDVYLQLRGNVWDFEVATRSQENVPVSVDIKVRLDFDSEQQALWWNYNQPSQLVEGFLSDAVGEYVQGQPIQELVNSGGSLIIRDAIVEQVDNSDADKLYSLAGIKIIGVEVTSVEVTDIEVQSSLENLLELELARLELTASNELKKLQHDNALAALNQTREQRELEETIANFIATSKLARELNAATQRQSIESADAAIAQQRLESQTKAVVDRFEAIAPEQMAVLQQVVNGNLLEKLAEKFGGSAQLAGVPLMEYLNALLDGTGLERFGNFLKMPEIQTRKNTE